MESPVWEGAGLSWWVVWVLWSGPAVALAGVGLIEFGRGSPSYDG